MKTDQSRLHRMWRAYRLRWKRRYFLARSLRRRRQLSKVADRTSQIGPDAILLFAVMRNESLRLPHFLNWYRALGVSHFLIVDNGSSDGMAEMLADESDVSLWQTCQSYKASRFGVDWTTWLQFRYANGHWCLTVDADELLVVPETSGGTLQTLTRMMDAHGQKALAATMIDLYPKGRLDEGRFESGNDPLDHLRWFDGDNFFSVPRRELNSDVLRGGVRLRQFFADEPMRAPTMNKLPLVKWHWRYAYMSSTHVILPPVLNETSGSEQLKGALLHTKFLPDAPARAEEERVRGEHFANAADYDRYYRAVASGAPLWSEGSCRYEGPAQLEALGLMCSGARKPTKFG